MIWQITWAVIRRLWGGVRWIITVALMLLILRHSTTQFGKPYYALAWHIQDTHFDYIGWELGAIRAKLGQRVAGTHAYLSEADRAEIVLTYLDDLTRVRGIEREIEQIYTDPDTSDAETATVELRNQRDILRADLQARQTLVEAILESQVSALLVAEGFGIGGQLFPPVWMRFTQQTMILVASPRDTIEMRHVMTTEPIPVDERERIEAAILADENLSSVILPIGGMALYPAMIVETTSLPYIVETFAHEWFHHYLMFHPLGWETEFFQSGEARVINETAASIFGREMARKILARYYPEFLPPEPPPSVQDEAAPTPTPPPPAFDFNAEMHETRITTDELLAAGEIEAAEAYMEERRALFVENGYGIRKLNQAWFSFYGGYQVEGISAGGTDPTGKTLAALRESSPSLYDWTLTIQNITTREALLALAAG